MPGDAADAVSEATKLPLVNVVTGTWPPELQDELLLLKQTAYGELGANPFPLTDSVVSGWPTGGRAAKFGVTFGRGKPIAIGVPVSADAGIVPQIKFPDTETLLAITQEVPSQYVITLRGLTPG